MKDRYYLMPLLDAWTNVFACPERERPATPSTTSRSSAHGGPERFPPGGDHQGTDEHCLAAWPDPNRTERKTRRRQCNSGSVYAHAAERVGHCVSPPGERVRRSRRRCEDAAGHPGGRHGRGRLLSAIERAHDRQPTQRGGCTAARSIRVARRRTRQGSRRRRRGPGSRRRRNRSAARSSRWRRSNRTARR